MVSRRKQGLSPLRKPNAFEGFFQTHDHMDFFA